MEVEINGHVVTVEQILKAQEAVDRINKARQEVREKAHIRALCRMAAIAWIEQNPVASRMNYRVA